MSQEPATEELEQGRALDSTGDEAAPQAEAGKEAAITDELRRMGERLASAIRAATGTPEAEALRGEVGDGLRKLRGELDGVLRRGKDDGMETASAPSGEATASNEVAPEPDVPEGERGETAQRAARVQSTVRSEIANALRALNGALDRLAGSIAPGDDDDAKKA